MLWLCILLSLTMPAVNDGQLGFFCENLFFLCVIYLKFKIIDDLLPVIIILQSRRQLYYYIFIHNNSTKIKNKPKKNN